MPTYSGWPVSGPRADQVGQQRRSRHVNQEQASREQCEAAAARDDQCLSRRSPRLGSFVLEPDEQIRREPGQLPEDEQER